VGHLRVFSSEWWYTIPKENIKKLDDRTSEAIMIGYPKNTKGYKLWDYKTQKVIISRDVLFKEEKQSTEICEQDDKCDDEIKHLTPNTKEVDVENVDAFESTNDASELDNVPDGRRTYCRKYRIICRKEYWSSTLGPHQKCSWTMVGRHSFHRDMH
jgi:hypothetical protein